MGIHAIFKASLLLAFLVSLDASAQTSGSASPAAQPQPQAQSQAPAVVTPPEVDVAQLDLSPIANYLRQFVVTTDHEFTLWHWFSGSGRDPVWQTNFGAHAQAGIDHMRNLAELFYQSYCATDNAINPPECKNIDRRRLAYSSGNMYGPGMYLSTDPVATVSYGQDYRWVLQQVTFPKGFRYYDMSGAGTAGLAPSTPPPADVQDLLRQMHCENAFPIARFNPYYSINLSGSSSRGSQVCRLGIRRVLKDYLKLGGFFYSYGASEIKGCTHHDGAFVLIDSSSIPAANVSIFNSQSRDEVAERVRITSLFYKVDASKTNQMSQAKQAAYLAYYSVPGHIPAYPNDILTPGLLPSVSCNWSQCTVQAFVSDPNDPSHKNHLVTLPEPPATVDAPVPLITKTNIPESMRFNQFPSGELIWPDLEGTPIDQGLDAWIPRHVHGCN